MINGSAKRAQEPDCGWYTLVVSLARQASAVMQVLSRFLRAPFESPRERHRGLGKALKRIVCTFIRYNFQKRHRTRLGALAAQVSLHNLFNELEQAQGVEVQIVHMYFRRGA
jgi:hypothetical protein